MELAITIEGLDELQQRFGQANPIIQKELKRSMLRAVLGELRRMPPYPPKPDGSTYVRTHYLERSLTALIGRAPGAVSEMREAGNNAIEGVVGTNVVYAGYVIGQSQAKAHRGRWWRLEESVLSHKADIEAEFEDAAARIAEQLEGAAGAA
jgi:hypothetical protein